MSIFNQSAISYESNLKIFSNQLQKGPLSTTKNVVPVGPSAESVLATIESDQELSSSPVSTPFRDRSLMEALLAQKMAQAAKVPSMYYVITNWEKGCLKNCYIR